MTTKDKLDIIKYTVIEGTLMAILLPIPLILLILGITLAYRL
jgi:hypothetical protein